MAMEFLASPYLTEDGVDFTLKAMPLGQYLNILNEAFFLALYGHCRCIPALGIWNPSDSVDPSRSDAYWSTVWKKFMPWIDWSGLDEELMTGWQRKLHIHTVPFYYVEYGLAQLGAVQV